MNDHASGLVDDGEVGVFEENVERDGLGFDASGRRRRQAYGDCFARGDAVRRLPCGAVDENVAIVHERLDAIAAQFRKLRGEETVEALAGVFGGNKKFGMAGSIVHAKDYDAVAVFAS
jgi:hypothetical protein